ncbi:hexapeptide transferase family protein [[Clostridium] sordellii]|uniref:acetyltransferase n=1 Tax=Paraclostridium sordellii TaxID=1505 RepID=UPI0005E14B1C|nr:acetyltransferase [Paeniclostridium sordellii]CEN84566.1 hexapeptide transferase family protein [[Clostridium] sordellii] [Paeniclostridium sordellii]CEO13775.1 hexapeptide transferase family protein [[Clostridium] sordellii] [Paeniclostridium sordellii]
MKNIIVIGAGGHASVVIEIIEAMINNGSQINIYGLLDDSNEKTEFMGYKILGNVENIKLYANENTEFVIAIGNNTVRKTISMEFKDLKYFTAIHPTAIISNRVDINEGTVIMPRVIINSNTKIGKHSIINSGSIIEHDSKIESFTHISPGVTLCGGVKVGEESHIGANSTVIQYKNIGANTVVGAGSTVINDIDSDVVVVGSPAKIKRGNRNEQKNISCFPSHG